MLAQAGSCEARLQAGGWSQAEVWTSVQAKARSSCWCRFESVFGGKRSEGKQARAGRQADGQRERRAGRQGKGRQSQKAEVVPEGLLV